MNDGDATSSKKCPINHNLIFDLTGDAIISIDPEQQILLFNKGAERIFGYKQEEVVGKNLSILLPERYHSAHIKHVDNFHSSKASSKLMADRSEVFGLRKDGSEFPAEASISKIESDNQTSFVAVLRDVTDRKKHDQEIEKALHEKELLLQEVHHRVKNNLQIISSLLNLQSDHLQLEQEINAVTEAQSRVRSIALIHERLYRSGDFSQIDFGEYLNDLIEGLLTSFGGGERIKFDINRSDSFIGLNQAVPVALIMNELITNSLKHAFPNQREGEIKISFNVNNNNFMIEISDNGVGLSEDFNILDSNTLGMQLVSNLVAQLEGQIKFLKQVQGFGIRISFPYIDKERNKDE